APSAWTSPSFAPPLPSGPDPAGRSKRSDKRATQERSPVASDRLPATVAGRLSLLDRRDLAGLGWLFPLSCAALTALKDAHLQGWALERTIASVAARYVLESRYCEGFLENSPSVNDFDEKTRVTQVSQEQPSEQVGANDCVVVIYTKEPTMLGKRI